MHLREPFFLGVKIDDLSFPVLCDHNTGQGHRSSPCEKGQTKKFVITAVIHVFRSDFRKEREK